MKASILRPGILVSLKTSLRGGVFYERKDLDVDPTKKPKKAVVARWETTRRIDDPAEHMRAVKARASASSAIRSACASTAFGLLCSEAKEADLDYAIKQAHDIVEKFNTSAVMSQISLYVIKGRIASTDQEAASAIASEIRDLLDDMSNGIKKVDAEAIRDAAVRAKRIGAMLTEEQNKKISVAIQSAREAAKTIVKRVQKEGEKAQVVIDELKLDVSVINKARMSFLDLEENAETGEKMPAANMQRAAGLEVE